MAPSNTGRVDLIIAQLSDPFTDLTDIKSKIQAAAELREIFDTSQLNDYQGFLSKLISAVIHVLDNKQQTFCDFSLEQKLHENILNLLHRLPLNEMFRPYAANIMQVLMKLLHADNEENAILCLKIMIDLHRNFKQNLEEYVQPFLDFVLEVFKNMPQVVEESFSSNNSSKSSPSSANTKLSPGPFPSTNNLETEDTASSPIRKSKYSFRVLTECPIIVVLLFQSHKQVISTNLPAFVSAIIDMLSLQASPQAEEHLIAASKNEIFTGVSPNISNKSLFGEFIIAQIKTMSFLAYVLRGFTATMKKYQNKIPEFCVRILKDCPPEISSARKELLVATRHILATDFRNAFVKKIDLLLDQRVLIGEGVTVHETLRPLAYSMLADLIHHVRSELNAKQISQTIRVYSANLHDWTLAISIQTMSAKLLLNMIDRIMKLPQHSEGRQLLIIILDSFAKKLKELNQLYPFLRHKQFLNDTLKSENTKQTQELESTKYIDIENTLDLQCLNPIEPSFSTFNLSLSPLKDARVLFKNLIIGLKPILFGLKSCNPLSICPLSNMQQWNDVVRGLDAFDVSLFIKIFHEGCKGFIYYKNETEKNGYDIKSKDKLTPMDSSITINIPSTREEKDVIEAFATIFMHIDLAVFQEIFQAQLPIFFEQVLENPSLLHIPQFFLTNDNTSSGFVGILLLFLKSKLKEVGTDNTPRTLVLLRFFKLAFMAVTMFPDSNETIIRPHLSYFIIQSFKLSKTAAQPMNYFLLLRSLFRSIGGGRFELLYKEVLPLLQVILEYLNNLIQSSRKPSERDLFVELCLTVPVRLSVLLPYLNYLMRPLVLALRPGSDQVSQGLRTLELCIDNLTQDFLDPILAPVVDDLMAALWEHLKPLPYNHQHSHTTLRILGKLGGRNRKFIMGPKNLNYKWDLESHPRILIYLHGSNKPQIFRPTLYIDLSVDTIKDSRADLSHKKYAYQFLSSIVKLFLSSNEFPHKFGELLRKQIKVIVSGDPSSFFKTLIEDDKMDINEDICSKNRVPNASNISVHEALWKKALLGCFYAVSIEELKSDIKEFIINLCRHLTFLELQQTYKETQIRSREFSIQTFDNLQGYFIEIFWRFDGIRDNIALSIWSPLPSTVRASPVHLSSHPDGKKIAYASNKSIYLRDIDNPVNTVQYRGHRAQTTVAKFSPSGYYVASGDSQGNVRIWDCVGEENVLKLETKAISGRINDLTWDGESKRIIAVGDGHNRFGHAFTFDTGNSVGEIIGHSEIANAVSIRSQRPYRAVTVSDDTSTVFYHGVPFIYHSITRNHKKYVHDVAFSPDGSFFCTVGGDSKIIIYDGKNGTMIKEFPNKDGHRGSIFSVSWSPDSRCLLTSSADHTCKIWDIETQKVTETWVFSEIVSVPDQQVGNVWTSSDKIISLSFSGDLNYLSRSQKKPIRVIQGHQKSITAGGLSENGSTFFTASYDGLVCGWDVSTGSAKSIKDGQNHTNQVVQILPYHEKMLSIGMDDTLRTLDTKLLIYEGNPIQTKSFPKGLTYIQGKSDFKVIVTVSDIQVFENDKRILLNDTPFQPSSTDGNKTNHEFAVGSEVNGDVYIFEFDPDKKMIVEVDKISVNRFAITSLAYSPNGKYLAVGDGSGKIILYDAKTKQIVTNLWIFHVGKITSISWNPASTHICSVSLDTHLYVYSVSDPDKYLVVKNAHLGGASAVVWLSDDQILSAGADACVKQWKDKLFYPLKYSLY
ncbi:hypothetical protein PORY_000563 [Pneumocystis oryctolagi]|uniref:Uncharacterized protein n=1 Tax=Pneumocystis oryctolagi TaxID=42067 RepID=A0ACB7CG59_9ASCO|nr:hypothetical protein PORY_000563 [Pneumocystis oryctolagi]